MYKWCCYLIDENGNMTSDLLGKGRTKEESIENAKKRYLILNSLLCLPKNLLFEARKIPDGIVNFDASSITDEDLDKYLYKL